jgi:hypothetical protein
MTTQFPAHLSEEALNDLLIGLGSSESEEHVASCAACRARVQALGADLKLLNETSMAWSRVRVAGMGEDPLPAGVQRKPLVTMGWTAAGVLLLALAFPLWHSVNQHNAPANIPPAVALTEPESEAQIAADNELLRDVDAAVNTNEASPFGEPLRSDRRQAQHKARPE